MSASVVACLGHAIPPVVRQGTIIMCAVRVRNPADRTLYFQSHGSFYSTPIKETRYHLSLHVDGVFARPVLVPNDQLRAGERAILHVPFHAETEGEFRLQLVMAEQHADPVGRAGRPILETTLRVTRERVGVDIGGRVGRGLFALRHTEIPLRVKTWQRRFSKMKLDREREDGPARRKALTRYKEINRDLAFMEKQVRRLRVASLPSYLGIDTTSRCNLHCKMCFREYVDIDYNKIPDLSEALLDRLIEELFPTAMTLNLSSGGEPLMSPYLDKILEACAAHQVYLSITTNGTMMRGDDFIRKLAAVSHHIEISVDSVSPERFRAFRAGASYRKVLENAAKLGAIRRALPDPKFNLGFSMTLFRENLAEIPEVLRVVEEVGGNFLKADIGVVFSKKELDQSVLTCPDVYNEMYAIAQAQARAAGLGLMMRAPFGEEHTASVKYGLCDYLYVSACTRSEGTLSPCYFGPALVDLKQTFRSAWNSEEMQRLRRDHDGPRAHPLCQSCYVFTDGGSSVENRRRQFLKGDAAPLLAIDGGPR